MTEGRSYYRPIGVEHNVINANDYEFVFVEVEFKSARLIAAPIAGADRSDEVKQTKKVPLPTKQQILEFIRESPTPVGKREIARAFHIRGDDRVALKALLKELAIDGELDRGRGRKVSKPGALPDVTVVQIIETDPDGEIIARPRAMARRRTAAEGADGAGSPRPARRRRRATGCWRG